MTAAPFARMVSAFAGMPAEQCNHSGLRYMSVSNPEGINKVCFTKFSDLQSQSDEYS
jgi:hypothetical protein